VTNFCPHCHQPISTERLGVRLPPLKAAIFDLIEASGDGGISSAAIIFSDIYKDRRRARGTAIKAHVFQINELIEHTTYVIISDRRRWFLVRRQSKKPRPTRVLTSRGRQFHSRHAKRNDMQRDDPAAPMTGGAPSPSQPRKCAHVCCWLP